MGEIYFPTAGFVVFKDKNWISERGNRDDLLEEDEEYTSRVNKKVADMFNYSALILDEKYYAYFVPL